MLQYKIAIISNFTYDIIIKYLSNALLQINCKAEFYLCPFNQYAQDILDPKSKLYQFDPEVIILALEGKRLFPDIAECPHEFGYDEKRARIENVISQIEHFYKTITENSKALVICHNFIIPSRTSLGILETKHELGVKEIYWKLNGGLNRISRKYPSVFVFDIESLSAKFGKDNIRDEKLHYLAAMDLSEDFLVVIGKEYLRYLISLKGLSKKCLALDLDNILWGGIVGEDGLGGIKLGNQPPGNIYLDFQKAVLNLYKRGIILCINSKNNFDDAMEVIRRHPDMVLKEEHFASIKINWNDKVTNLKEISKELNISLDSFVFIDDDPIERKMIAELLPQVEVVDMPEDPALFRQTLEEMDSFETPFFTDEDKLRGSLYIQERKRQELKSQFKNVEEFLKSLNIKCCIKQVDELSIPRTCQLIQRTNQFNLTTRRYTQVQLLDFLKSDKILFMMILVEDIFGKNGIVGTAIVVMTESGWELDTFLLSCRVLGRKIEHAFLVRIIESLALRGATELFATFIPTKKNALVRDFLINCGFQNIQSSQQDGLKWRLDLNNNLQIPKWVHIIDG